MKIDHYDCRTGGSYRYVHASDGNEYAFHGSFHEVRPSELIVQTFTFEGFPDQVALEKMVLEDLGNGRTRLVAQAIAELVPLFTVGGAFGVAAAAWAIGTTRSPAASESTSA